MASTYTVKSGDSLSKIAQALNVKGGWRELYNLNKNVIKNPNLIYAGMQLSTGAQQPKSTTTTAEDASVSTPLDKAVNPLLENIKTTEETFREKFPMEQFMPEERIQQFAESQVNPEYMRMAQEELGGYDLGANISGAYRTGEGMRQRQSVLDSVDRQRKAAMQDYMQGQRDLFTDWYGAEMKSYMTDPSKYVMTGYENQPWYMGTGNMQPGTQYQYNPVDFQQQFQYGGYGNRRGATPTYGEITPVRDLSQVGTSTWNKIGGMPGSQTGRYELF